MIIADHESGDMEFGNIGAIRPSSYPGFSMERLGDDLEHVFIVPTGHFASALQAGAYRFVGSHEFEGDLFGLQIIGQSHNEDRVMNAAGAFERIALKKDFFRRGFQAFSDLEISSKPALAQ